ncbi:MAG: putative dehydrogenase [Verrucomicrobiales bacterium]|nr:putative dehydrogenase [Verrucomicrobiales bacterium]
MHSQAISRRAFARKTLFTVGALTVAPAFLRGKNLNSKLNIAVIACGGRGAANMHSVSSENIVALCDVNLKNLETAAAQHPKAKTFRDFRKLFDRANDFDAVTVSTCEHTHAFATMLALHHNKHVYCEKPLTYNIYEARKIREAARKAKVATQMGIQIHAHENYRRVVEMIQSGAIGPVHEAHVWVSRAWGWQSKAEAEQNERDGIWTIERPKEAEPRPVGLDWDLWLGPAPYRPFNHVYFPGPHWYRWWDFGNGTMSDLGSHWNDLAFWALKLEAPLAIEAHGPPPHPEIAPASMHAVYEYGARGEMPPVKLTWYQGSHKPDIWNAGGIPKWDSGVLFIGSKGMLLANYNEHKLLPEKDFAGYQPPAQTIPRSPGHHEEWIACCKSGQGCSANFEYSGLLTEANHLGNVAYRVGKKIEWDSAKMRVTNTKDAEKFIHREYRKGWKL